jgi:hypothetical protein
MLGSGIIDVAIGLAFVFGVTAALSSVFTELIARFLGLRGAYLLRGLRELLDGTGGQTPRTGSQTALKDAIKNYQAMKDLVAPSASGAARRATAAAPAKAPAPAAQPGQVVLILIGFLITIIALTPGARFWFDLLSKLGSLRSTGPKPAS